MSPPPRNGFAIAARPGWKALGRTLLCVCLPLGAGPVAAAADLLLDSPALVAHVGFDSPAVAQVDVALDEAAEVRWLRGALEPRLDFSLFQHEGQRLDARYVERLSAVDAPTQPSEGSSQPGLALGRDPAAHERTTELTLHDFRVEVAGLRGAQEFSAFPGRSARVESEGAWRLSTALFGRDDTAPLPLVDSALAGRSLLLLEGDSARLTTAGGPLTRYYGFEVVVRHREGTETFKTGTWSESVAGPLGGRATLVLHEAYLELRATEATLATNVAGATAQILSPALVLSGRVDFARARADLEAGPRIETVRGKDLRLEGAFAYSANEENHRRFSDDAFEVDARGLGSGTFTAAGVASASHGAIPAGVVAAAAAGLGLLAAVWLFTRLTRADAESHPLRRRLIALAAQNPGISLKEASRSLGCGWGTIVYHVAVAERSGLIQTQRICRRRCLFTPGGRVFKEDREGLAVLYHTGAHRLLSVLLEGRCRNQADLAARLECSQGWVSRCLRRLRAADLVDGGRFERGLPRVSERARRLLAYPFSPSQILRSASCPAQLGLSENSG